MNPNVWMPILKVFFPFFFLKRREYNADAYLESYKEKENTMQMLLLDR